METIENAIDWISNLGSHLFGLSGFTLTVLFCLALGFLLKKAPFIPNDGRIPIIVVLVGVALGMLLADPTAGTLTFRLWLVKNGVVGGLAGFSAWVIHSNRKRIPLLKNVFVNGDDTTPPFKPEDK